MFVSSNALMFLSFRSISTISANAHCERCGEVFVQTEPIAKLPHTVVMDEVVEPACGQTGLTEVSHCSVCGEVIVAQEIVPALNTFSAPKISSTYFWAVP